VRHLRGLRWQLTFSHLQAIAFTLVSMTVAITLIATGWFHSQDDPAVRPAQDARIAAGAIGPGLVASGDAGRLSGVLAALLAGDVRVTGDPAPAFAPWGERRFEPRATPPREVAYMAVVGPDGRVLGSSDPAGAAFAPPERAEWTRLVAAALGGERDASRLTLARSGPGPVALGAAPVLDDGGRPIAAVVVGRSSLPVGWPLSGDIFRAVAVVGASLVVLLAASLFALVSAGVFSYLLSRRLVARLERLGRAADALAAGDLSQRVGERGDDEVGRLARRFDDMACRLQTAMAELEATLKTKRELVANVSHELRTPLASIQGHVESLLMQGADADAGRAGSERGRAAAARADREDDYLRVIHRESEHLSRLVDDLFVLSTAEAGALPLSLGPVPLGEVVEEVAESVRPAARRERHVTIVTEVPAELPPALADRQRVAQILANLVRNALRHTPEGGLVSLRAARQDGRAVLTVEDTGAGIAPEQLARVFDRFYRVDESRARDHGGAGLGLAIVRELAEAMGGQVAAESTVGVGSKFSVSLPLVYPPAEVTAR
jgi:signal transduction histidine kinase